MRIGFFDSGVGGVSVLAEALEQLPDEEYLFDADTDHVPYGEKTAEEIAHYAMENARFLLSEGAEAIVVACNTATAVAITALREALPVPVIGMEPAVKPAVEGLGELADKGARTRGGEPGRADVGFAGVRSRVLVSATPVTLREAKLKDLIHRVDLNHRVDLVPLPGLVPLAEREAFDGGEARAYLAEALAGIDPADYAAFVMGCTHFLYFTPLFRELLGSKMRLVDGNAGTVRRLADVLGLSVRGTAPAGEAEPLPRVTWYRSGRKVVSQAEQRYFARFVERMKKIKNI